MKIVMMNQSGGGVMGGKASAARAVEPEQEQTTMPVVPYFAEQAKGQPAAPAHQAQSVGDDEQFMPITPYFMTKAKK